MFPYTTFPCCAVRSEGSSYSRCVFGQRTHRHTIDAAGCTPHCLCKVLWRTLSEQSDSITAWDWAWVRWTPSWFPATLTCLTSHYSKLIKSPQVSYLSVCFTKTSSTQVPLNLVNISDNQFTLSSWVTSGLCVEKCLSCNLDHSEQGA